MVTKGVFEIVRCALAIIAMVLVDSYIPVYAASTSMAQSVSVTVPPTLSLTASATSFILTYNDYLAGSESDVQSITYSTMCNQLTPSGRVEIKLPSLTPKMDLKADGQPYIKQSGSASLVKSNTGYMVIGTSPVKMYDQRTDSDTGMTTRGTFSIHYRMTATADLDHGTYAISAPTVTLYTT